MAAQHTVFSVLRDFVEIDEVSNTLRIAERLSSKLYGQVAQLIRRLGGQWKTSGQYYQFCGRPAAGLIERALETGSRRLNKFHYYPTPRVIIDAIFKYTSLSYVGAGGELTRILEPSCGEGALIRALQDFAKQEGRNFVIDGVEIDPLNALVSEQLANVICGDFLELSPSPVYDVVVLNPPFSSLTYIKHIRHAQKFLKPNGVLISVTPTGFIADWPSNRLCKWLMERAQYHRGSLIDDGDWFPPNTFNGVSIPTTIIEIDSEENYQQSFERNKNALIDDWCTALANSDEFITLGCMAVDMNATANDSGILPSNAPGIVLNKFINLIDSVNRDFHSALPVAVYGEVCFQWCHKMFPMLIPELEKRLGLVNSGKQVKASHKARLSKLENTNSFDLKKKVFGPKSFELEQETDGRLPFRPKQHGKTVNNTAQFDLFELGV